jgi:HEPN domain-containing protein
MRSRPVEKAIKAVLAAHGVEYAKTHQLAYLIDLLEKSQIDTPRTVLEADELSPWAVDFRYETDDEPALDRRAALALIENIRAWAGTSVGA